MSGTKTPGRRRLELAGLAVAALTLLVGAATFWVEYRSKVEAPETPLQTHIKILAHDMRNHYRADRATLEKTGVVNFSDVDEEINTVRTLDSDNGQAWYYEGEVERVEDTARFTSKSCVKQPLAPNASVPDRYHNEFYRYLDIEGHRPIQETGGDTTAESCYERSGGYCPQRTAWILNLLAHDFYAEAMAATDSSVRLETIKRARAAAERSLGFYRYGFEQCKPITSILASAR